MEPAERALGALAGAETVCDGGGGYLELVLHSVPTTWLSLRAELTWVLHPVQGLSNPLPAYHSALAWERVQPILWVDLIAQVTHLARRKGNSGWHSSSALGSMPTPTCPNRGPRHRPKGWSDANPILQMRKLRPWERAGELHAVHAAPTHLSPALPASSPHHASWRHSTDILLTEFLSGADQEGRDEDVRRGQSPAWHELSQTPLVVTHAIFQAMVAHTPSHALTVELTHHPLGHSLMCSHHSTLISLQLPP